MLRQGLTHPCQEFGMLSEIVYAKDDDLDKVVCAQLFNYDKYDRYYTVYAYTHPEYRGLGLAVNVFKQVEDIVMKRGAAALYTNCDDDNEAIQTVFEKTGRQLYSKRFAKMYKTDVNK